jgi:hypothetical protein
VGLVLPSRGILPLRWVVVVAGGNWLWAGFCPARRLFPLVEIGFYTSAMGSPHRCVVHPTSVLVSLCRRRVVHLVVSMSVFETLWWLQARLASPTRGFVPRSWAAHISVGFLTSAFVTLRGHVALASSFASVMPLQSPRVLCYFGAGQ